MTTKDEVLIKVENLQKHFGENKVLDGITTEIHKGEVVAIIGPSGSGKSTFLRSLNLLEVPTGGRILFENVDITDPKVDINRHRQKIGMVFQQFNLFPHKTVKENIMLAPVTLKLMTPEKASEKAEELLRENVYTLDEIVEKSLKGAALWEEVKDRLKKPALGMSGGQQQRLCIARALSVEPEVLLMDEPTSALDPISTLKIEDLMEELKQKYTVVIVTHNMQQAARISDYTAFFLNGEVIEFGETNQIFSMPKKPETEDYITGRFG